MDTALSRRRAWRGSWKGGLRYALGRDQCTSAQVGPLAPADVKVRLGMQNLYASAGHQRNDLEQLAEMAALGLDGAEDGLSKRWVKQAALIDAPGR